MNTCLLNYPSLKIETTENGFVATAFDGKGLGVSSNKTWSFESVKSLSEFVLEWSEENVNCETTKQVKSELKKEAGKQWPEFDVNEVYANGDMVMYQGKPYQACIDGLMGEIPTNTYIGIGRSQVRAWTDGNGLS